MVLVLVLKLISFEHRLYTSVSPFSQNTKANITVVDELSHFTFIIQLINGYVSDKSLRIINKMNAKEVPILYKLPALI